ncbi:MAG: aminotransferase class I/II-fold pyridoxal phosphate-dependent enzyme [Candidatus Thermoplasmatota archaeon]|jgi:cystathionine beta-lyase/cystathionine gamma-synthase|nr:aminotransferase class I/II-fold pyridoxal phosphate-dependent enzyme [Candidatus Thermoplasmatota archaeon]MCL5786124.1 aminotransferase class I/II-fold pyridoxal phosphate-dependent enzyme [Candidatus Thermoplasmatota archaeon]
MERDKRGFNTRVVQSGELKDPRFGNVTTPIFENSTFESPNVNRDAYIDDTTGKPFLYTRWGNPTIQALEEKYSSAEGSERGLAFSSGMGAINAAVLSFAKKGDRILSLNELYGQTFSLFAHTFPEFGIGVDFLHLNEMNGGEYSLSGYKMLYTESVVNPTMGVSDLEEIGKKCAEEGVPLLVDATFATPYNQRPLEMGASVVVHSASKYISGHTDVIMGMVGCMKDNYGAISTMRKTLGSNADPLQAFLAMRGLKTLGLRMEKHNSNGMKISRFLEQHEKVRKVMYPGLESFPYYEIAKRNLSGFGGMVAFEVKGGLEDAREVMRNLKLISPAPSLGGVESLMTLPVDTSHVSLTPEERADAGIADGLIRLSLGIEDPEDIIEDLDRAMNAI